MSRIKHRLMILASFVPALLLDRLARWEGHKNGLDHYLSGPAFWQDAQYWAYCRSDRRDDR
jgi:hypothetical protein